MSQHGKSGMKFAGKVTQVITASTGLDDWEWGVTLWARNPSYLKDIVYTMRFDESSAKYALFGAFYFGYILPAGRAARRRPALTGPTDRRRRPSTARGIAADVDLPEVSVEGGPLVRGLLELRDVAPTASKTRPSSGPTTPGRSRPTRSSPELDVDARTSRSSASSPSRSDGELVEAYRRLDLMQAHFLADQLNEAGHPGRLRHARPPRVARQRWTPAPQVWVRGRRPARGPGLARRLRAEQGRPGRRLRPADGSTGPEARGRLGGSPMGRSSLLSPVGRPRSRSHEPELPRPTGPGRGRPARGRPVGARPSARLADLGLIVGVPGPDVPARASSRSRTPTSGGTSRPAT